MAHDAESQLYRRRDSEAIGMVVLQYFQGKHTTDENSGTEAVQRSCAEGKVNIVCNRQY